jgi:hypothetical protein
MPFLMACSSDGEWLFSSTIHLLAKLPSTQPALLSYLGWEPALLRTLWIVSYVSSKDSKLRLTLWHASENWSPYSYTISTDAVLKMLPLASLCSWHWGGNWLAEPGLRSLGPSSLLIFCKMIFSGCFNLCCFLRQRSRLRVTQRKKCQNLALQESWVLVCTVRIKDIHMFYSTKGRDTYILFHSIELDTNHKLY